MEPKIYDGEVMSGKNTAIEIASRVGPVMQSQAGYHTAMTVQQPRSLPRVMSKVLEEAELAGDAFFYRWPVKTKDNRKQIVEGGSVGLALAIAREWTNCAIPVEIEDKGTHWIFKASFVDLERGFTVTRTFQQSIPLGAPTSWDVDRWRDVAFQKGQSKAIRNVIFAGVPRWLVQKAIEAAKEAAVSEIKKEGIEITRGKMLKFWSQYGISEERISAVIGKKIEKMGEEDLAIIRNFARQVVDGDERADELFPEIDQQEKPKAKAEKSNKDDETEKPKKRGRKKKEAEKEPDLEIELQVKREKILKLAEELGSAMTARVLEDFNYDSIFDVDDDQIDTFLGALMNMTGE